MTALCTAFLVCLVLINYCFGGQLDCSRETSRKVRNLLQSEVFSSLGISPLSLPATCPLHPELDMYRQHELHKSHEHGSDWQCRYCNKRFINEKYIDRHMERMHSHLLPANATICIGDYSKMFGFRTAIVPASPQRLPSNGLYAKIKKSFGSLEKCTSAEVTSLTNQCYEISKACFESEEQEARFNNLVCSNLKCVNGVLKGGLYKGDGSEDYFTLRMLCIGIVVVLAFLILIQVFMTESIYNQQKARLTGRKVEVDHLHRHQRRSRGYGWFLDTVLDALEEGRRALLRSFKSSDKQR